MQLTPNSYHRGRNTNYITIDLYVHFPEVSEILNIPYTRGYRDSYVIDDKCWKDIKDFDYTQIMDDKQDVIQQLVFGINPKIEKLKSYHYGIAR